MRQYICTLSNDFGDRTYRVTTSSAMKCAKEYGRYDGHEVVTVSTTTGRPVSRAIYSPENGGSYYRAQIIPALQ